MKNIRNLDNFTIPEYEIEYSDKHNIQFLNIHIYNNYQVIETVQYENKEAKEIYSILISEDTEQIKEIFEDIFINYMERV